jgi:serine protease Do
VLAVGNPFGLGGTVTAGIVSARGRDLNGGPFDDYLQIDAPINQGNSGGPTFDESGKVIGVNTAIFSPSGGSVGIGFAIPANIAEKVVADLRDDGKVERGWIGVQIQEVTPAIAEGLGLEVAKGALVAGVSEGGPAAAAGLRAGDVILRFDGKEVAKMRDLPMLVADTPAGKRVDVEVWRGGQHVNLTVAVAERSEQSVASNEAPAGPTASVASSALGVTLAALTPELKQRYAVGENVTGVLIVDVAPDGPAADLGLRPGDVIAQVAQEKVTTPGQVDELIGQAKERDQKAVVLLVSRDGEDRFVAVELGRA